jgi:hypothetical protein
MIFKKIVLKKQNVDATTIEDALHICYEHICFSTFPYIMYGIQSSDDTLNNYNSGNCIALSLFIKKYLKNMGIDSHLIPASVPIIHKVPGVNHICHVSLLIPIDSGHFFVLDPAFYFLSPIECDLKNNQLKCIHTMDIHGERVKKLRYVVTRGDNYNQHDYQVSCYFDDDVNDTWSYYVQEVGLSDADKYIGAKFMEMKPEPFIIKTGYDAKSNTVKKLYHIKQRKNDIVIIKNNKEVYDGKITKIPTELKKELNLNFYKYFNTNSFN